jgi:hypothetical protein
MSEDSFKKYSIFGQFKNQLKFNEEKNFDIASYSDDFKWYNTLLDVIFFFEIKIIKFIYLKKF